MKSIKEIINESDSVCPYSNFSHPDCFELTLKENKKLKVCPKPFDEWEFEGEKYSAFFALNDDNKVCHLVHNDSQNQYNDPMVIKAKSFHCPRCGKNIFDQLK